MDTLKPKTSARAWRVVEKRLELRVLVAELIHAVHLQVRHVLGQAFEAGGKLLPNADKLVSTPR